MLIVRAGGASQVGRDRDAARADAAEMAARHAQQAAADVPEVTGQRGQRQDRAHRRAGAAVALQAEPEPDRRTAACARSAARARPRARPAGRRSRPRARRGHSASRASSSGQPSVWRSSQSRSSAPSSSTTRMRPSASAASVPGRGARCSSQRLAVSRAQRVDRDDVRAGLLRGQHEAPLVEVRREQVGAPQQDQPRVLEVLGIHAHGARRRWRAARRRAAAVQIVVWRRDAPIAANSRGPMIQPWIMPSVPAK